MNLREYLATNPDGYAVDEHGLIRSPGKFQGEPLYVPFFHGQACEGFADRSFGDVSMGETHVDLFEITFGGRLEGCTVLSIEEDSQGFVTCNLWEGDTLDQVESELTSDEEDEPEPDDEPCEGDYMLSNTGRLGGRTGVATHNGVILTVDRRRGSFASEDEALAAIREHANKVQFWPNVWRISDHGNAHRIEGFSYDSRGTWIAEGRDYREGDSYTVSFSAKTPEDARAIVHELQSIAGSAIAQPDGAAYLYGIVTDLDEARAELRLANFKLEVRA